MALSVSLLRRRPRRLLWFRGGVDCEAPCRPRALSLATGTELPRLSGGRGGRSSMDKYASNPTKYWEQFYRRHDNKFFKDRHYLEKDWGRYFAVANDKDDAFADPKVVLELGCGAGNTLFPLLDAFPNIFLHACDISPHAISLVKVFKFVQPNGAFRHGRMNAFVCDVTQDDLCKKIDQSSVDIITMIFMLSAVSPVKMPRVLQNIKDVLKPSGSILFRDYAVGDFSQEKLAIKGQMISENFYARGDGTCVFYFSEDSLSGLFGENGLSTLEVSVYSRQVENRSRKIVMDRHWIRAVFRHSE